MNDYPLSNDITGKDEETKQVLPQTESKSETKPLFERTEHFSVPNAFAVEEKPVAEKEKALSIDAMPKSAPMERDKSTLSYEVSPARPTAPTQPSAAPTRPTVPTYPTQPSAAPTRPTAPTYPMQPSAAPVRPTAPTYPTQPSAAPVRPTAPTYPTQPSAVSDRPTTPSYSAQSDAQSVRTPAPKAKKKKNMGLRMALIALCCALVGSALGGVLVGYYFEHYRNDKTEAAQTEQQASNGSEDAQASEPGLLQPTTGDENQSDPQQPNTGNDGQTASRPTTLSQLYSDAVPSIVGITNTYTTYDGYFGQPSTAVATGTGFVISADGEILTNYHVVENAENLTVTFHDGTEYTAKLLGYEAESDVALLKIDAEGLTAVKLGDSDAICVGEQIAAIGNPLGELTYTMTVGYVSAKGRAVYTDDMPINMMQIDAAINSGNSGGPLFNLAGEVVGITTAKYSGSISGSANIEGIGFAIPINDVLSILDDLRKHGSVQNRAYIGVTVTNSVAGGDIPAGALVQSIEKNSSGEKAGLRVSDIIIAVGDTAVSGIDTLYQALRPYRAGDTVTMKVFRSGDTIEIEITFDATPGSSTQEEEVPSNDFEFPWG